MNRSRKVLSVASAALLTGPAVTVAVTVVSAVPAAATTGAGCRGNAYISRLGNTQYSIQGKMSCTSEESLRVTCYPVHKHTVGWDSHTSSQIAEGPVNMKANSTLTVGPATVGGTDGDTYKTHCNFDKDGSRIFIDESDTVTL